MEVFIIMIQSIFPSQESAPTRSTIVIRGLSLSFLPRKGLLCLHNKQNNTWLLVDTVWNFSSRVQLDILLVRCAHS